jgi:hypothetical protein
MAGVYGREWSSRLLVKTPQGWVRLLMSTNEHLAFLYPNTGKIFLTYLHAAKAYPVSSQGSFLTLFCSLAILLLSPLA